MCEVFDIMFKLPERIRFHSIFKTHVQHSVSMIGDNLLEIDKQMRVVLFV